MRNQPEGEIEQVGKLIIERNQKRKNQSEGQNNQMDRSNWGEKIEGEKLKSKLREKQTRRSNRGSIYPIRGECEKPTRRRNRERNQTGFNHQREKPIRVKKNVGSNQHNKTSSLLNHP